MNSAANTRIWYFERKPKEIHSEFIKQHPELKMRELMHIANRGEYGEFCQLCNFLVRDYHNDDANPHLNREDHDTLVDICNNRIHRDVLKDYDEIYCKIFKHCGRESSPYFGDQIYMLFTYDNPPYSEASTILSLVDLIGYLGQPLKFDDISYVYGLSCGNRYWELYPTDTFSYDIETEAGFEFANYRCKQNIIHWQEFMKYAWYGQWEDARELIQQYDDLKEKLLLSKRQGGTDND